MTALDTHKASRPGYPPMVTHRFTIRTEHKTGADLASCGPYHARSLKSCAARKLARDMVEAGEPDGPVEAWHNGRLDYTARSLVALGKRTLSENPRLSLKPWIPEHRFADSGGSEDIPATLVATTPSEAL